MQRWSFPLEVRGSDLDRDASLAPATIARLMEHLRWRITGPEALGISHLFADGSRTVVRVQRIWTHAPIGRESRVRGDVWLQRAGRTSFEIGHRLIDEDSGAEFAAGASIDVLLGRDGRPTPIPARMHEQAGADADLLLLQQDGLDDGFAWPDAPVWTHRSIVLASQLDLLRHMNQARYLQWFDDVRLLCAEQGGYRLEGFEAPVREAVLRYEHEVRHAAAIVVETAILSPQVCAFRLRIEESDRLACVGALRVAI